MIKDDQIQALIVVPGQPPRKSNSRRIVTNRRTGKPMVIKSKDALAYEELFEQVVPATLRGARLGSLEHPLRLDVLVYYKSRRPDVSIELIKDCLQKTGVISDDRYIREQHAYGLVDRDNPRAVICISRLEARNIPHQLLEVESDIVLY